MSLYPEFVKGVKSEENTGHLWHLDMDLLEKRRGRIQVMEVEVEEEEDKVEEENVLLRRERLSKEEEEEGLREVEQLTNNMRLTARDLQEEVGNFFHF